MIQYVCKNCGSHDLYDHNGYKICRYCESKFQVHSTEVPQKSTEITIEADVKMLLKKCQDDPLQVQRYASLVLDIDPSNIEAIKYLKKYK